MSAQGDINWPHGTRSVVFRRLGHTDEDLSIVFTNPDTSEEIAFIRSGSIFLSKIPANYTQLQISWPPDDPVYTSPVWDLEADETRLHLVFATEFRRQTPSGFTTRWNANIWPVTSDWPGGYMIVNEMQELIRVTIGEVSVTLENGEYGFISNPGAFEMPDPNDLQNWFNFNEETDKSWSIEYYLNGSWEEVQLQDGEPPSPLPIKLADSNVWYVVSGGEFVGDGFRYLIETTINTTELRSFLWDYFAPALA